MNKKKRISTTIFNSAPRFLSLPNLFSDSFQDPSLAKDLIEYLEANKKESLLDITADTVEEVVINSEKDHRVYGYMDSIVGLLNKYFCMNSSIQLIDSWNESIWIRKFTKTKETNIYGGEGWTDKKDTKIHYDYNSNYKELENEKNYSTPDLASLSVALNDGSEYGGGEIVISSGYDAQGEPQYTEINPKLDAGDGIVWDGWTLHGINPVTSGVRYVLVAHFQGTLIS